jgi:hypothetical protein
MNERNNEGDDMDKWGEDNGGNDDSDDEEIVDDDDDDNYDDEDDSEDSESDEEDTIDVEKFIRTFHNGGYDANFDDAFSFDRSAALPNTRPTQASYDKPDNWRERNSIGLERVKEQLQHLFDSVSSDTRFELELTHNTNRDQLVDNEEPIVWNDLILDEHWYQIEEEIDRRKQQDIVTNIHYIDLGNVEITKERLAALVAILHSGRANSSSKYIEFNNTNLCGEGIVFLSKLVDVSIELQDFRLHHNRISSMESACCLSRSLKSHNHISWLYLTHCDLGSSPEILLVILQADVMSINLENNNIDSLGAVTIAEYLEGDPPIEQLSLDHNRLNDDDAVLISQALKRNTNLDTLHIHFNNLTSIGVKALLTCVFNASSLNAISESNHTLREMIFFTHSRDGWLQGCIYRLLSMERTQKILLALQDKDSLLQYLANIPVELIPKVLAFFQQGDNQCQLKHLNIAYSTMRWWNMPMLYSYHNYVKSDTKRKRDD